MIYEPSILDRDLSIATGQSRRGHDLPRYYYRHKLSLLELHCEGLSRDESITVRTRTSNNPE